MMKSVTQSNRRYEVEFEVNKRKQTERVKKKKKTRKKRITKEMKEALATNKKSSSVVEPYN